MREKFRAVVLCHKKGKGTYKLIPKKPLTFNLTVLKEKFPDAVTSSSEVLMLRKEGITYTIMKNGKILIEGIEPDTPEYALELLEKLSLE